MHEHLPREIKQTKTINMPLILRRQQNTSKHAAPKLTHTPLPWPYAGKGTDRWIVLFTYPPVKNCRASAAFTVIVASCGFTHFHSPVEGYRICNPATGWRNNKVKDPRSTWVQRHKPGDVETRRSCTAMSWRANFDLVLVKRFVFLFSTLKILHIPQMIL